MTWKAFLDSLVVNWKTSLGGILTAIPAAILAAGFTLSPTGQHWLALCTGIGALLVGFSAKDASTHSTTAQVKESTIEVAATEKADAKQAKG